MGWHQCTQAHEMALCYTKGSMHARTYNHLTMR